MLPIAKRAPTMSDRLRPKGPFGSKNRPYSRPNFDPFCRPEACITVGRPTESDEKRHAGETLRGAEAFAFARLFPWRGDRRRRGRPRSSRTARRRPRARCLEEHGDKIGDTVKIDVARDGLRQAVPDYGDRLSFGSSPSATARSRTAPTARSWPSPARSPQQLRETSRRHQSQGASPRRRGDQRCGTPAQSPASLSTSCSSPMAAIPATPISASPPMRSSRSRRACAFTSWA